MAGAVQRALLAPRRVVEEARTLSVREVFVLLRDAFDRNDLLTYASAISFKLFFAAIPLALFALGLLGGSGLTDVWASDVAPQLRQAASPAAYALVDDTVRQVLASRQVFWATAGGLLAVWEMSGALRAVMGVLSRVYGADDDRSFARRMAVSCLLAAAVIVLLFLTATVMALLPRVLGDGVAGGAVDVLRWPAALALLWVTVTLVMHVAPDRDRPTTHVTFGSTLVIVSWLLSSVVFGWYLTNVAHYGSVFGALATVVVALTYLYLASIAFLVGVQLDALVQQRLNR